MADEATPTLRKKALRGFRFFYFLILGFLGFWIVTTGLTNIRLEQRTGAEELIQDKPKYQAIVQTGTDIFDNQGHKLGTILENTVIYTDISQENSKNLVPITVYGWIWSESVVERDGLLILDVDENIRYKANTTIIGRLKKKTILELIYQNEKQSWYLFSLRMKIPANTIQIIESDSNYSLWDKLTKPRTIISVTTQKGGLTAHTFDLIEPLVSFVLLFIVAGTLLWGNRPKDTETIQNFKLEVFKSVLQVAVGVILAFIIFSVGWK